MRSLPDLILPDGKAKPFRSSGGTAARVRQSLSAHRQAQPEESSDSPLKQDHIQRFPRPSPGSAFIRLDLIPTCHFLQLPRHRHVAKIHIRCRHCERDYRSGSKLTATMWIEPSQAQEVLTEQKRSTRTLIHKLRKMLSRSNDRGTAGDGNGRRTDKAKQEEKRNGNQTFRDGDAEGHLNTKAR